MSHEFKRLELEKYKKEGSTIKYHHVLLIEAIREHVEFVAPYTYKNLNTIDKSLFKQKTENIVEAYKIFNDAIKDKEALNSQTKKPYLISQFTRPVQEYIRLSKKIAEIISDESKYKALLKQIEFSGINMTTNSPENLQNKFSDIIRESNMIM